ncbi:trypsin-2-like [Paramacrobiotus metropolitanus]|uniref:trypsin-2-like n=1 Tax=Paramacrobiotus metropolitanus TaxID=2943436 RepID=UPI00244573CC|nr:trypsin-2-like [Paramacrobiotus metropolitanus]
MSVLSVVVVLSAALQLTAASPTFRIVGGAVVAKASRPYQVHIRFPFVYNDGNVAPIWGCGGVIIGERWILTAAHCVHSATDEKQAFEAGALLVRAGQHDTTVAEKHAVDYAISTILPHPNYTSATFADDIALLRTRHPITFTPYIQPLPLPAPTDRPTASRKVTVSGWGSGYYGSAGSTRLRAVDLQIVDTAECNRWESYNGKVLPGMFCAAAPGKSSCGGDSGGPVTWRCGQGEEGCREGEEVLGGLVSWAMLCAQKNYPSVFVDVGYYLEWIYKTMAENSPPDVSDDELFTV